MLAALSVASFVTTFVVVRLLLARFAAFALDEPNARSLHESPVPRTGGIAILAGAAVSVVAVAADLWLPMLLALSLAAISLLDDLRGLPAGARLLAHFAAAGFMAWHALAPMQPVELAVIVVALVWITNLYNFMDGSDGLAAGMSVIGFGAYALGAWLGDGFALATLCTCIAAASAAFLAHNFHPARIFLGDVGSVPLGFLAAALGILGWRDDLWPLWFPLLVFGAFIGDATLTLIRRLLRRERVWQAHRDHYYQRMVRMGIGHRGTALLAYTMMLICSAAALVGRVQAPVQQAAIFAGATLVLVGFAVWVDLRWARYSRGGKATVA